MELAAFLKIVWPIIMTYGPGAIGWLFSCVLAWHILQKRKEISDAVSDVNDKLLKAKDDYILEIQNMNGKLAELNSKHMEIVSAVTDARVDDLKELTADYNKLASETLRTMDRFVVALEVSNNLKGKKRGGE